MKRPLSLFCLLFVSAALAGEPLKYRDFVASDAKQAGLMGQVKMVRTKDFLLHKDGEPRFMNETTMTFDPQGYALKATDSGVDVADTADNDDPPGEPSVIRTKWFYDENGNLIAEEKTQRRRTVKKTIRILPESRRVIKEEPDDKGRMQVVEETTYDKLGQESETRIFDDSGKVRKLFLARYDAEKREKSVTATNAEGQEETVVKTTWDARGFTVAEETDTKVIYLVTKTTYEYPEVDAQGNWTKQISSTVLFQYGKEMEGGSTRGMVTREITCY